MITLIINITHPRLQSYQQILCNLSVITYYYNKILMNLSTDRVSDRNDKCLTNNDIWNFLLNRYSFKLKRQVFNKKSIDCIFTKQLAFPT